MYNAASAKLVKDGAFEVASGMSSDRIVLENEQIAAHVSPLSGYLQAIDDKINGYTTKVCCVLIFPFESKCP